MTLTSRQKVSVAALLLRLTLGVLFLAHSVWLKYVVFTLPGTARFFESVGLAGPLAYPVFVVEVAAGLFLIAGWQTRWASLATMPVLLGAAWVHAGNGWVFSSPGGGWEYPAFWIVALLVQAVLGDGDYTLKSILQGGARDAALRASSPG